MARKRGHVGRGLVLVAAAAMPSYAFAKGAAKGDARPPVQLAALQAQDAGSASPEAGPAESSPIGAVIIVGNEALPDAHYQTAIEAYFGQPGTEEVLAALLNEIAQLAHDEGYAYARAEILPATSARGIVQIAIDEGRIDDVIVEGYQNGRAIEIVSALQGKIAHRPTLETALLQLADIPAVRLRSASFKRIDGRGRLEIGLAKNESSYRLEADNYGTQSFGPWRARASMRHVDVLTSSDELNASIRINPLELGELLHFSASYETQVTAGGPVLAVTGSIGNTAPGGAFAGTELTGDTRRASVSLTQPLIRTRDASVWADVQLTYLSIEQDVLDTILRSDTVVTASVGLRGQIAFEGGLVRGGLRHVRGIDLFGATRLGTPLASRRDGDGVFSKVEGWLDTRIDITGRVQAYLLARGQIADRPLLSSQEMGLGGAYTVRGYDFSEVLGDEGIYGLAELRYGVPVESIPLDALQLYAFVDGGYVSDIASDLGEGSLFSAGPGVRARIGPVDLELESAFPLGGTGERNASNDPEINLRAGVNF